MSDFGLLAWVVRAVSFFNTVAFFWLGLTVLLNAQRRAPGAWLTGGGLLLAGLFFAGHSTLVGRDLSFFYGFSGIAPAADLEFWWRAGWLLFVVPPGLWCLVIAWYSGFLDAPRRRALVSAVVVLGLAAILLLAFGGLLPAYREIGAGDPATIPAFSGVSLAAIVYPTYSTLCIALALWALTRPAASDRLMGDLARRRARPWLIAASLVLLAIGVAVGVVLAWLLRWSQLRGDLLFTKPTLESLLSFDLAIASLLAVVAVLLGRAIVSYEVFTGKALPRGGLLRHWLGSLIFAAGYAILLASSLILPVEPIYHLVLATVTLAGFLALLSWRAFAEREASIRRLRPFVVSRRLFEHLAEPAVHLDVDPTASFRGLCDGILGARVAYLAAIGPLAPLFGQVLAHPAGAVVPPARISALANRLRGEVTLCLPVDPAEYGGAIWGVPLTSGRGLIGALLLGERRDGVLYVQEEIELARAACEGLIDTQASAEMARRLISLQRRRLVETQVLDRRARHALHDDILPRLHAAILAISSDPQAASSEAVEALVGVHRGISELLRTMPKALAPEFERHGLIGALRQTVEGELRGAFDGIDWRIQPDAEVALRALPPLTAEVLFGAAREAIRNSARHGRGADPERSLRLTVTVAGRDGVEVVVEDDGVGLGGGGGSAGCGQGLALHGTLMAVIGGSLVAESRLISGARVALNLPENESAD